MMFIMIVCLLAILCIVVAEYCTLQFLATHDFVVINFDKVFRKNKPGYSVVKPINLFHTYFAS